MPFFEECGQSLGSLQFYISFCQWRANQLLRLTAELMKGISHLSAQVTRVSPDYSLLDVKWPDGIHHENFLRGLLETGLMAMFSMIISRSERQKTRRGIASLGKRTIALTVSLD